MTATKYVFGHLAEWVYSDTREPVGAGDSRPCPKCGRLPNPDGTDPCLGHLPGMRAACCGHGVEAPWVITDDGEYIDGWENIVRLLPPEMREAYISLIRRTG